MNSATVSDAAQPFRFWAHFPSSFLTIPSSHICRLTIKEKDHSRPIQKGAKRINTKDKDEIMMTGVTETMMTTTDDAAAKTTTTQDQIIHVVITMITDDDDTMMMKVAGVDINVWLLPLKEALASCQVKATWISKLNVGVCLFLLKLTIVWNCLADDVYVNQATRPSG